MHAKRVDAAKAAHIQRELEEIIGREGFEAVRTVWNRYSSAMSEKAKLEAERREVEKRLGEIQKKLGKQK